MPRLSIVIPCLHDAVHFEATLASVLQNRPDDCEVLVVQPRSYDDPYELADEVRFVEASSTASLVDLVNAGIESSSGSIVHMLSCDAEVVDGWTEPALACFDDPTIAAVSPLLVPEGSTRVLARGVRYGASGRRKLQRRRPPHDRSRWKHITGPTLSAGFYRRQSLREVGGFSGDVGGDFADVDVALALQSRGYRARHVETSVVELRESVVRRRLSFRGGRHAERLFWRHAPSATSLAALLLHGISIVGEVVRHIHRPAVLLQTLGRAAALFDISACRRHRHRLASLEGELSRGLHSRAQMPASDVDHTDAAGSGAAA